MGEVPLARLFSPPFWVVPHFEGTSLVISLGFSCWIWACGPMAERLRDLSQPIDVPLLDATVAAFYGTGSKEEVRFPLVPGVLFGSVSFVLGFLVAVRCSRVGGFCPPGVARTLDGIGGTLIATSFFRLSITSKPGIDSGRKCRSFLCIFLECLDCVVIEFYLFCSLVLKK